MKPQFVTYFLSRLLQRIRGLKRRRSIVAEGAFVRQMVTRPISGRTLLATMPVSPSAAGT